MATVASRFLRYIPEEPMAGPDVREVQQRLREQGFYQGALDGIYGRATYDAVIAFQARRGLTVDGIVGPSTYNALGAPPTPPAIGKAGPSVTIDLEKRKLYLQQRGMVTRTYDVAVGAPSTPTPVGRWVIVQKTLNPGGPFGTRWIRINVPWGGYGIHGTDEPELIGQAVSHGCVRMRNADVEDLYAKVPVGAIVNITGQIFTGRVLFWGEQGADVRLVQEILKLLGYYQGTTDGVFGPMTHQAVRAFQRASGLTPDGIVGPLTYDALQQTFDMVRGFRAP
ncbi:MAG: L,D-transpeptidase family protein [Bacillota bacterium]